ncbi:Inner membrane protein YgaZ [Aedoeadaptatus ivorii]|uniref:Inner membrane protein YgaZ n=1 Tax=Aedoeadaptatus ivorii TaxID=54006 RepID=A0A3S4YVZ5_9FIRM|nr:AzlC family ABC transporter permease [Peptoniphilus ivorii]MDQ0508801.1 4-azaleucine resistance transporter AzlC [Peptoniphilus ivorii]VEJ36079.1 Inner membrane protein YgaZ [Peptoniphilus ivorii]
MKAFRKVFPRTVPILITYAFLGMGFGVLVKSAGQSGLVSFLMSFFICAGAMQFATVGLFAEPLSVLGLVILTLSVNLRYLFYTLSLLTPLQKAPLWKQALIAHFASDETFSLYVTGGEDGSVADADYMFAVGALNFAYWVVASVLGVWVGTLLPIDATGIDFLMTALFIVTVIDQWEKTDHHLPTLLGFGASVASLLVFGPDKFILPAMAIILAGNLIYRRKYE